MLPVAVVFAERNHISEKLVKSLLSKQCSVVVSTKDASSWESSKVFNHANITVKRRDEKIRGEVDYFVLLSGFSGETDSDEREGIQDAVNFLDGKRTKSLFVLPFLKKKFFEPLLTKTEIRRVYLGEIYGKKMNFDADGYLGNTLSEISMENKAAIPSKDEDIFVLYVPDAVLDVVRFLFSYGFSGKSVTLARKTTIYKFLQEVQKEFPGVVFYQTQKPAEAVLVVGEEFTEPRRQTEGSLKKTISWLLKNKPKVEDLLETTKLEMLVNASADYESLQGKKEKKKLKRKIDIKNIRLKLNRKFLVWVLSFLLLFSVSPAVALLLSVFSLKLSLNSFLAGRRSLGEVLINVSDVVSEYSYSSSGFLSSIPVLGIPYKFINEGSVLSLEASVIGKRGAATLSKAKVLFGNVLNDQNYDLLESSRELSVNLELLYQDSSFLQGEIEKIPGLNTRVKSFGIDLDRYRSLLLQSQVIAKNLPDLLGQEKPKTYLVLFQNNMELRPAGGFIGSFALASFDKGKLINVEFFDVYTADGQLKGHVEPPTPIKNYLGEANWYLRDSNWDPDFGVSSQRAEWFLDKELDRSVDGVIGVDLEVPESLLKDIGPVRLTDYNQEIDYKNLYEKVQYEVESKFFPGSQNKKNLLTALGQAILEKFKTEQNLPLEKIAKSTLANLEGRHIQIFMHNSEVSKAFSSLGFGGEVIKPACSTVNCIGVLVGLVEANVGVDKANYFVARNVALNSFVTKSGIENTLTVELKNNAPVALGVSGRYKNYIRLITNSGAKVKSVGIIEPGGTKTVNPDIETISGRTEVGTIVDIPAGVKRTIRFTWTVPANLNFVGSGSVTYLLRKQAGVGADPVAIKINPPSGVDFLGKTSYNMNLDQDLTMTVSW